MQLEQPATGCRIPESDVPVGPGGGNHLPVRSKCCTDERRAVCDCARVGLTCVRTEVDSSILGADQQHAVLRPGKRHDGGADAQRAQRLAVRALDENVAVGVAARDQLAGRVEHHEVAGAGNLWMPRNHGSP